MPANGFTDAGVPNGFVDDVVTNEVPDGDDEGVADGARFLI
jgi:hypothetical protein